MKDLHVFPHSSWIEMSVSLLKHVRLIFQINHVFHIVCVTSFYDNNIDIEKWIL
jgi:hypothetical protein